jgi:metal-dependent amidase/aminoacylase/carboxypeptidase family protein
MADVQKRLETLAEHCAQAYNCSSTVDYLQSVPAVHNEPPWLAAGLPTFQRVVGADKVVQTQATLGYDDVSEFVNRYGGLYVTLGVQDTELDDNGNPRPTTTSPEHWPPRHDRTAPSFDWHLTSPSAGLIASSTASNDAVGGAA